MSPQNLCFIAEAHQNFPRFLNGNHTDKNDITIRSFCINFLMATLPPSGLWPIVTSLWRTKSSKIWNHIVCPLDVWKCHAKKHKNFKNKLIYYHHFLYFFSRKTTTANPNFAVILTRLRAECGMHKKYDYVRRDMNFNDLPVRPFANYLPVLMWAIVWNLSGAIPTPPRCFQSFVRHLQQCAVEMVRNGLNSPLV